jgi:hypothetical protein
MVDSKGLNAFERQAIERAVQDVNEKRWLRGSWHFPHAVVFPAAEARTRTRHDVTPGASPARRVKPGR